MPIQYSCHACGEAIEVDDDLAGLQARCPYCNDVTSVPSAPTASDVPYAAPVADRPAEAAAPAEIPSGSTPDRPIAGLHINMTAHPHQRSAKHLGMWALITVICAVGALLGAVIFMYSTPEGQKLADATAREKINAVALADQVTQQIADRQAETPEERATAIRQVLEAARFQGQALSAAQVDRVDELISTAAGADGPDASQEFSNAYAALVPWTNEHRVAETEAVVSEVMNDAPNVLATVLFIVLAGLGCLAISLVLSIVSVRRWSRGNLAGWVSLLLSGGVVTLMLASMLFQMG